eukprot:m.217686 g.217686  ORF g.217686 m.217686 type:complete len:125 (-) comp15890_c1_seq4:358-732(-)
MDDMQIQSKLKEQLTTEGNLSALDLKRRLGLEKKDINRNLYDMERKKLVTMRNGTPPIWSLSDTSLKSITDDVSKLRVETPLAEESPQQADESANKADEVTKADLEVLLIGTPRVVYSHTHLFS